MKMKRIYIYHTYIIFLYRYRYHYYYHRYHHYSAAYGPMILTPGIPRGYVGEREHNKRDLPRPKSSIAVLTQLIIVI